MISESRGIRPVVVVGVYACFFLSGVTGLVYEVVWMRNLSLVLGHTTYAITAVLGAFMAGLALGSFLLGRLERQGALDLAAEGYRMALKLQPGWGLPRLNLQRLGAPGTRDK